MKVTSVNLKALGAGPLGVRASKMSRDAERKTGLRAAKIHDADVHYSGSFEGVFKSSHDARA